MASRPPETRILDYLRAGPETAPNEFVEATLRPIPHMRQRRPWRIRLEQAVRPVRQPVAIGLALVIIAALLVVVATIGGFTRPQVTVPTFQLAVAQTDPVLPNPPDTGTYASDPTATTNRCELISDGFWRIRYSGGDPYVRLDGFVGPAGAVAGRSEDVSVEIVIGSPLETLLNFDQPGYRSGDAPGRSTATVDTTLGDGTIDFHILATTPSMNTDFSDDPYTVDVDLRITCPT